MQTFHNTTHLTGEDLKRAVSTARSQEAAVFLIYLNTRAAYTPSDISIIIHRAGHQWLLTSIRRSISNLTEKNDLVRLPRMKLGMYGAEEHYWQLNVVKHPTRTSEQINLF